MDQRTQQPTLQRILTNIFVIFSAVTLPGLAWSLFGWIQALLPLIVFAFLCKYGVTVGGKFVLAGAGLAAAVGFIVPGLTVPLFSLSMLPAGLILAASGLKGESPALSGFKTTVTLAGCWALLIAVLGAMAGESPFGSLVHTLHTGIDETVAYYRQSMSLEPDALMVLESTLLQMKVVLPIILPAMFCCCAMFITWLTMVVGNRLAAKAMQRTVWPSYRYWQLPDRLIWLAIIGALPALVPGLPRHFAVNLLLVLSVVYCFQGFALCVFFTAKWRVPPLLRSFIYVMLVFQSFGTLVLLIAGIADVWFDFRKLHPTQPDPDNRPTDD